MRVFLLFITTLIATHRTKAQELIEINATNRCIHKGDSIEAELFKFPLTATVPGIVEKILTATNKTQNFELVETNVENVATVVDGEKRYLLYNPDFIHRLTDKWETYAIIAHAIGHHVNEHTLLLSAKETEEQEAYRFAGYTLTILGAHPEQIKRISFFRKEPEGPFISMYGLTEEGYSAREGSKKADISLQLNQSLEYFNDEKGNFKPPIPMFDWPPRKPSATFVLEDAFNQCKNLAAIDKKLRKSLNENGYYDKSYFYVPNGFVIVTRLEQINEDATPKKEPKRWETRAKPNESFSLTGYLKSLFFAQPGYFRIIAFVVTSESFTTAGSKVSREAAVAWLSEGANVLPEEISNLPFNNQYNVTALVYEFKTYGSGKEPTVLTPSDHTGKTHLEKSNIWQSLKN